MRLAAYAGTSVALAAGIVIKALHSRPNFYSISVYFAESNAALMILSNLVLLVLGSILVGLQHVLYGPLRPIEIEQLYEKAWFAVTETCLAMTIFREELGVWFVVMFVSLLVARIWGWIGEGRLEILEQQPPENPRLFHARLSTSLILSMIFNGWLLDYSIQTVRQTNRPNMMVMFAFEFALLNVSSLSTAMRYTLIVLEALVVRAQTKQALDVRRKDIEEQRKAARDAAAEAGEPTPVEPPIEELLDEADVDVPGWEDKSRWVFYLDLTTDFLRLVLYVTFFCVLCRLYGMPIHIIRDVALVVRSFYRRVTDFIKYRHATRDMHARYPDATEEEITSQDVCIICREGMRARAQAEPAPASPLDERLRPKKLPCGHILHFACLRSWLERQQNCPTCRQPVLSSPTTTQPTNPANPANNQAGRAQPGANNNQAPQANLNRGNAQLNRMRTFNLGPLRLTVGTGHVLRVPQPGANPPNVAPNAAATSISGPAQAGSHSSSLASSNMPTDSNALTIQNSIAHLERMLLQDTSRLRLQSDQLHILRQMQMELHRLRYMQGIATGTNGAPGNTSSQTQIPYAYSGLPPTAVSSSPQLSVFNAGTNSEQIPARSSNIPAGVTIPDGWTLLPLQRLPESAGQPQFPLPTVVLPSEQRSRSAGPSRPPIPNARAPVFFHPSPSATPNLGLLPTSSASNPADANGSASLTSEGMQSSNAAQTEPVVAVQAPIPRNDLSTEGTPAPSRSVTSQPSTSNTIDPATSNTSGWQWPTTTLPPTPTSASMEPNFETNGSSQAASSPSADGADAAADKSHTTTVEDVTDED